MVTEFYNKAVRAFPFCFKAPGWEDYLNLHVGFSQILALLVMGMSTRWISTRITEGPGPRRGRFRHWDSVAPQRVNVDPRTATGESGQSLAAAPHRIWSIWTRHSTEQGPHGPEALAGKSESTEDFEKGDQKKKKKNQPFWAD